MDANPGGVQLGEPGGVAEVRGEGGEVAHQGVDLRVGGGANEERSGMESEEGSGEESER